MEGIIRFTDPEQDERLKLMTSQLEGDSVIKNIYGYLKQYGAVRKDVYEFLLREGEVFCKPDYNFLIELLRGQAERAWFELFLQIGNETLATSLYKREVIDALRKGMPVEVVKECYEKASTPFDMCMLLQRTAQNHVQDMENEETEEKKEVILLKTQLREAMEKLVQANEELERLRKKYEGEEKSQDIQEEMQEEKVSMPEDNHSMDGSQEEIKEWVPEEENIFKEIISSTVPEDTVRDSSKKKALKIGNLFQRLRRIRQRAVLEKMTEQRKMEELFVLLRQQKYTTDMIKAVRKLIEYGITFEFLYAFIESEATEAELEALVEFKTPTMILPEDDNIVQK